MRFEKWQALGNDYAIVEERELPFELTAGAGARALRVRTPAWAPTASCCVRETDEPGFVAEVRIFNPDGSEAELSGNGVRQAVMYLRRSGWTGLRRVLGAHRRGRGPAAHHRRRHVQRRHGTARLRAPDDFPAGGDDGVGDADRRRPRVRVPVRPGGQPPVRDRARRRARGARPARATGRRSRATSCSRAAPTCHSGGATGDAEIRARIFERGVGETMSSGTGASGAAVAAVRRGRPTAR